MKINADGLREFAAEAELPLNVLKEAVSDALLKAYERGEDPREGAYVNLDMAGNRFEIMAPIFNDDGEAVGEEEVTPDDFGRVAASTVRSVIVQRLRQAEDARVLRGYQDKVDRLVRGTIASAPDKGAIRVDLDNDITAIMPRGEQVPSETYRPGKVMQFLLIEAVRQESRPRLVVSRTHPDLVRRLFEFNVPELARGDVEIMAIAREAGHRSKVAVRATSDLVRAKGACIGENGMRVRAVMQAINDEKLDIVDYSDDPARFIANALSPARVKSVQITSMDNREARVVVPAFQLSLAIGKEGQNARLAARLTGWKIDIHSDEEPQQ